MATELGTAYLQVIPSARGIKGSLTGLLEGEADQAGTSAGNSMAGKIKGAIAAAGIGVALTKSLQIGGDIEQSFGGLETIYGKAAEAAKGYAKEAYQAGISTNSYAEQAVSFGAALKQAYQGDTAKAVEAANTAILDMTDNAAKMGTPIESIQNAYQGFAKQNYTMLDNLKLGYGGTKQEMERLLADAEKLSGQKYDISNLGDVYDAIHVIQGELGLTGVAAKEASETFTGSLGAMKAAGENLLGSLMLGQDVAPAMQNLVDTTITFVGGNLIPAIGNILMSLPTVFKTAWDNISTSLGPAIQNLAQTVSEKAGTIIPSIMNSIMNFSGELRGRAGEFVDAGLELIKSLASGIIKNIPVFIKTVPTILSNFAGVISDNAPKIISTAFSIIKNLAAGLLKAIPTLIQNIPKILKAIWDCFMAFGWLSLGKRLITGIAGGIKNAAGKIGEAVKNIVTKIKNVFTTGITAAKTKVGKLFDGIKKSITDKITAAKDKLKGIIDKIKDFFPFKISKIFGKIKLPHFKVSGGKAPWGIMGKGKAPSISIKWYKKAEDQPYMFSSPTLFGAGEHNDEILYGRRALMKDIASSVRQGGMDRTVTVNNYITVDGAESPEDYAERLAHSLKMKLRTI